MYELQRQDTEQFPSAVLDENGSVVARVRVEADAHEVVTALDLVERAVRLFPGLIDGETPVPGAGLVDLFSEALAFREGRYHQAPSPV
jgi:hypothetical protein